jgi:hypothetical protein
LLSLLSLRWLRQRKLRRRLLHAAIRT